MSLDARLARTLCARLCHDLGGAVGTLAGTLDLAGTHGEEMLALSQETAMVLRQRLRLYTAAWGGPSTEFDAAGLGALLEGAPAWPRVRFALDRLAPGMMLPAPVVPLALNAALLAAEALPRGGTVVLSGSAEAGLLAWPDGKGATWPASLLPLLGGAGPGEALAEGGPRRILGPLLLALAAEVGWGVSRGLATGDGLPPLTLMPILA